MVSNIRVRLWTILDIGGSKMEARKAENGDMGNVK